MIDHAFEILRTIWRWVVVGIVASALIEGATFFTLIVYMTEGKPLSLIIAVALIAGQILHVPTRSRLVGWIEGQLVQLEQQRQLSDMRQ